MVEDDESWVVNIKQELQSLGLGQMWGELFSEKFGRKYTTQKN